MASGGLFLTPSGVEHRFGVRAAFLPWEHFEVPQIGPPFRLHSRLVGEEHKTFPYDIPIDVTDRVPRGGISAPTPYLSLEAADLVVLLEMYARSPHLQAHLGTTRSLEWQPWTYS